MGAPEAENERRRGGGRHDPSPGKALNPFFTLGRQLVDAIANVRRIDRTAADRAARDALSAVQIADPELAMRKYRTRSPAASSSGR